MQAQDQVSKFPSKKQTSQPCENAAGLSFSITDGPMLQRQQQHSDPYDYSSLDLCNRDLFIPGALLHHAYLLIRSSQLITALTCYVQQKHGSVQMIIFPNRDHSTCNNGVSLLINGISSAESKSLTAEDVLSDSTSGWECQLLFAHFLRGGDAESIILLPICTHSPLGPQRHRRGRRCQTFSQQLCKDSSLVGNCFPELLHLLGAANRMDWLLLFGGGGEGQAEEDEENHEDSFLCGLLSWARRLLSLGTEPWGEDAATSLPEE
ncbi:UNVERIFIED_CONTAM: hypothetical protein FKN15_038868 [Acipenser sinensis]